MAKFQKKRNYKKKPYKQWSKSLTRLRPGVPNHMIAKLRYMTVVTLSPGPIGLADGNVFSLNGLYDPNISGAGGQPRFFDQYCGTDGGAGMYKHYTCLGARVTTEFTSMDSTYNNRCYLSVRDSSSAVTDYYDLEEASKSKKVTVAPKGSGGSIRKLSMNWSAKKWFGRPNVTTELNLTGSNSTNPSEQAYLHVSVANPSSGSDSGNVSAIVIIDYLVKFHSPVQPAES